MTTLVGYMVLFTVVAILFIFVHLMAGRFLRPIKPDPDKLTIYECGEPTIGSAWVQFDVRFYVVALLFVIFDVEVAFFFPWAVVFGHANTIAKADRTQNPPQVQVELAKKELLQAPADQPLSADTQKGAARFAWLALVDIAVFFGVLLVGFAYLWRRGDLNWVRSTAAERAPIASAEEPVLLGKADELVAAEH
jgi:NADH-quinone oxidoreductase subunit A